MPLYEYRCQKCGNKFEKIEKFSDEPTKLHPECGGEVERLISAPALQFKGTGWYVTDYAKSGSGGPKEPSKGSSSSGEGQSDSKSDPKKGDSKKSDSGSSTSTSSSSDSGSSGSSSSNTSSTPSSGNSDSGKGKS